MAKSVYRRSSLSKLASPDQLDRMIVVISPANWFAILGGIVVVVVVVVWSIIGWLPSKITTSGLFMSDRMNYMLASDISGQVKSIEVDVGDVVTEGQVLVELDRDAVEKELETLNKRLDKVEVVTLTSVNDEATADNQNLINLKTQMSATGIQSDQNNLLLAQRERELADLNAKVNDAKNKLDVARAAYYESFRTYSNPQLESDINIARQNYLTNNSAAIQAGVSYDVAISSYYEQVDASLTGLIEKYDLLIASSSGTDAEKLSEIRQSLKKLRNDSDSQKFDNLSAKLLSLAEKESGISEKGPIQESGLYEVGGRLGSSWQQAVSAKETAGDYSGIASGDKSTLDSLQGAYNSYVTNNENAQILRNVLSVEYETASSNYNQLNGQKLSLEETIIGLRGQKASSDLGEESQNATYTAQFIASRDATINTLKTEIEKNERLLSKSSIKSTVDGRVSDIKINIGSVINAGNEIIMVTEDGSKGDLIQCYVPLSTGKKAEVGMQVMVYPTTVNRQEYGHMEATITSVDDYVSSTSSIRSTLGDEILTNSILQSGPVVGVTCKLREDKSTRSGYYWSSKKGVNLTIPQGTPVTIDIVTEKKHPISMLIPYLKDRYYNFTQPEQKKQKENNN